MADARDSSTCSVYLMHLMQTSPNYFGLLLSIEKEFAVSKQSAQDHCVTAITSTKLYVECNVRCNFAYSHPVVVRASDLGSKGTGFDPRAVPKSEFMFMNIYCY